jgi:hypothetical protein
LSNVVDVKTGDDPWTPMKLSPEDGRILDLNPRPRTYRDCLPGGINEARPCPWYGCRHHNGSDVSQNGTLVIRELDDMRPDETCSLDVARRGGITLEEIGRILILTRERIRQVEVSALLDCQSEARAAGLEPDDRTRAKNKQNGTQLPNKSSQGVDGLEPASDDAIQVSELDLPPSPDDAAG